MLRGRNDSESKPPGSTPAGGAFQAGDSGFPSPDQPYATDEHPTGILFYHGKVSFFLPYHLLQTMRYEQDKLSLVFATDNVEVTGRGLHTLYVQLARQKVYRVIEQGERYAAINEAAVMIVRIERSQRTRDKKESPDDPF